MQAKLKLINPLRANPTKWSTTLKQFVGISQRKWSLAFILIFLDIT